MSSRTRPAWSRGHALLGGALALLLLTVAAAGAAAWRYSDMILGPDPAPTLREQRVLAAAPGRVRLTLDRQSLQPGTWALEWEGGYAWVGRVLRVNGAAVERELDPVAGRPPVGGWASLRGVSRSADPRSMLGLGFTTVSCAGPLGPCPAWLVPGPDSTWVLYVHGRGANRAEGLRTLGVLARRGLPGLLVSYRNDVGAPRTAGGRSSLGLTEWMDLEAAARYALAHGARDLVLAGYSMGGQVVMQFMARSSLAARVRGIVLESPLLDWNATLDQRARVLGVPAVGTWLGKRVATLREGLDWRRLDLVTHAADPAAPMLILHGLNDSFTPESVSETYAREHPRSVTLVRVGRGDHVEAWNADPARYAADLGDWCAAHGIGRDPR